MLWIVSGLAPVGRRQADGPGGRTVRDRGGVPQRHAQRPPSEVLDNGPGQGDDGDRGEGRDAGPVPVPAQPGDGAATALDWRLEYVAMARRQLRRVQLKER